MNCARFEQLYLDGPPDNYTRALLESHVRECPDCARLLAAHRLVLSGLSAVEPVPAPSGFEERVMAAVAAKEQVCIHAFPVRIAAMIAVVCGIAGLALSTVAGNLMQKFNNFVTAMLSWFGTEQSFPALSNASDSVWNTLMEYLSRADSLYAVLFVPIDLPLTSLSIAPIYVIALVILVIQLGWYLSFADTGIAVRTGRK